MWVQTVLCPQGSDIDWFYGNGSSKMQSKLPISASSAIYVMPVHPMASHWTELCNGSALLCYDASMWNCVLWGEKRQTKQQWKIIRITSYDFISLGKLPLLVCVLSKSHGMWEMAVEGCSLWHGFFSFPLTTRTVSQCTIILLLFSFLSILFLSLGGNGGRKNITVPLF